MSITIAMAPLEAVTDDKGLPTVSVRYPSTKRSNDVLVKASGFKKIHTGYYCHLSGKWHVYAISGPVEVTEWWPLPKEDTGVKVEV